MHCPPSVEAHNTGRALCVRVRAGLLMRLCMSEIASAASTSRKTRNQLRHHDHRRAGDDQDETEEHKDGGLGLLCDVPCCFFGTPSLCTLVEGLVLVWLARSALLERANKSNNVLQNVDRSGWLACCRTRVSPDHLGDTAVCQPNSSDLKDTTFNRWEPGYT